MIDVSVKYLYYLPTSCICADIEEHHLSLKNANLLFKNAKALQNPFIFVCLQRRI
jgi:hypothetical protein